MQGDRDGVHAAHGEEGAFAMLQTGDHAHEARRPVGVAAVVGGEAVEELHGLVMAIQRPAVDGVQAVQQFAGACGGQGFPHIAFPQVAPAVQGVLQKGAPRGLQQLVRAPQVALHPRGVHAELAEQLFGHAIGIAPAAHPGAVLPEVAVGLLELPPGEPAFQRHTGLVEQLRHQSGPREQRGTAVEAVAAQPQFAQLAAGTFARFVHGDGMALQRQADAGGQPPHAGADHDGLLPSVHDGEEQRDRPRGSVSASRSRWPAPGLPWWPAASSCPPATCPRPGSAAHPGRPPAPSRCARWRPPR